MADTTRILSELKVSVDSIAQKYDEWALLFTQLIKDEKEMKKEEVVKEEEEIVEREENEKDKEFLGVTKAESGEEDKAMLDAQKSIDILSDSNSESDNEAQDKSIIEALETALLTNPSDYDSCVQYIKLLRKLGNLEKLRQARETMGALLPRTSEMWREWAKDEIASFGAEAFSIVKKVYERGVCDYLSVVLRWDYLNFVQEYDPLVRECSAAGISKAMNLFERALTAVGLHLIEGHKIWESYREFEEAIFLTIAETDSREIAVKEKSLRKNAPTLTSTLTARSKDACGLRNKPKEQAIDIDEADLNKNLAVVEYVEDMYQFYKSVENESRPRDYIHSQPEINEKMRAILIDWLVQIHHKFKLSPETLYLTINIVDRYRASKTTARRELQLVGLSSMLIASKYEEIWAPEVNDLVCISDRSYSNQKFLIMKKKILGELEWYLTVPTPDVFFVRFIKASMIDSLVENMVYFLAELGMMNYETIIYCPSMLAAAAVYAARCALHKTPVWNETLKKHTGFSEEQIMDCAKLLATFHSVASDQKLKGIYRKYTSSERGAVALMPPQQFPGSHPVSLDRENLHLLRQHYYYATWKADGTRYMMLITMDVLA